MQPRGTPSQTNKETRKGAKFRQRVKTISDVTMVSKWITLLALTDTFNEDIQEWRQQSTNLNKCSRFNIFFQQAHVEQRRVVTTQGKRRYIAALRVPQGD